ncbi:MAG TPA: hypothetical protein VM285_12430 [Polyangia bacterium]|nr:hypothetical protein [Polyangia bacterium]
MKGPGFSARIAAEIKRIDPGLHLVFDPRRAFWIVVRKAPVGKRAWWSGHWHTGWEIVLRWAGVGGQFRAAAPRETLSYLPLDSRLVTVLRFGDQRRRGQAAAMLSILDKMEQDRWRAREERRIGRKQEAEWFADRRHGGSTQSIGGLSPGRVNDYETEEEAVRKMRGRQRAAFLRSRGGDLPPHLRELEHEMAEKEEARRARVS